MILPDALDNNLMVRPVVSGLVKPTPLSRIVSTTALSGACAYGTYTAGRGVSWSPVCCTDTHYTDNATGYGRDHVKS